jgi:hypothetical protein
LTVRVFITVSITLNNIRTEIILASTSTSAFPSQDRQNLLLTLISIQIIRVFKHAALEARDRIVLNQVIRSLPVVLLNAVLFTFICQASVQFLRCVARARTVRSESSPVVSDRFVRRWTSSFTVNDLDINQSSTVLPEVYFIPDLLRDLKFLNLCKMSAQDDLRG